MGNGVRVFWAHVEDCVSTACDRECGKKGGNSGGHIMLD